eukprot:6178892-Pleurochrysis_carterae.AAC.2
MLTYVRAQPTCRRATDATSVTSGGSTDSQRGPKIDAAAVGTITIIDVDDRRALGARTISASAAVGNVLCCNLIEGAACIAEATCGSPNRAPIAWLKLPCAWEKQRQRTRRRSIS